MTIAPFKFVNLRNSKLLLVTAVPSFARSERHPAGGAAWESRR